MEEFNASAGTQVGPEDRAVSAALDAGRLGGVLLQLQRERFDGVLNIACEGQAASIGFRAGSPVTFDDPTPGHTLADQFVEREQLTREQCNKVLARMTDALVDDEAVAFCEQAVLLGFLTEDEAKVELSSRIRARMIQLFGWRTCESSLTPGIAALLDRPEYPQNVGAILYMGVRTFYDEELLNSCHPDLTQTYVRLSVAPATIVQFFGLDDEEFQLLRRIQPDDPAALLVETRKVERVHLLALLLLLRMAQFCEVFNHAQPRGTSPRMPHRSPREREATGPVREDKSVARRVDLPREEGSVARRFDLPGESARRSADTSRDDRSGSRAGQLPRDERSGSGAEQLPREGRPVTRNDRSGSRAGQLPRDERSASQAGRFPRDERSASQAGQLPRDERSASQAGQLPRGERSGSRAEPLPRDDRSGSRAGQLPRDEHSASQAGRFPRDERSASQAGQLPRDERSASQAGQLPRGERSGSRAEPLPRDDRSGSRAGQLPRDERSASQAGRFPRDERSANQAGQFSREDPARARDRSPTRRMDELPRGYSFARSEEGLARDERTLARDRSPTRRTDELAGENQPSSTSEATDQDQSFAGLAEELSSNDNSFARRPEKHARDQRSPARDRSAGHTLAREEQSRQPTDDDSFAGLAEELSSNDNSFARSSEKHARDQRSPARDRSAGHAIAREEQSRQPTDDDSFAGLAEELSRDDKSFARSSDEGARDQRDRSAARKADGLLRDERSARSRSGARGASTDDDSFAGLAEDISRDDSSHAREGRNGSAVRGQDERSDDARPVARMASTPPEPAPVQGARMPVAQTPEAPPSAQQQAARSPLLDPPAPGRSARPTVDATQEALLEAAARTARMRRSLPARRNSKQADPMPGPAAEGGNAGARNPDAPGTYTNAYATKSGSFDPNKSGSFDPNRTGSFDPSKSGSFDPNRTGSFDPSKSGSFDPNKTGPTDTRPEYAKAHLKELIARRKQTANAPDATAANSPRNPARELREARGLLHAQHFARAEKVLSGLVELEPANDLYKTYHLWARWRAQPEAAESLVGDLQDLAKKLVSDAEHGAFAAYVLGHVFFHNKRDDLAERFFKRAHAADRSNKDAERHLMILERRKQSAADGGSGANRKLFGIQLPNKPKT